MRSYTITESNAIMQGLLVQSTEAGHGVLFQGEERPFLVPVEKRIDAHLTECTRVLSERASGSFHRSELLGEEHGLRMTPDDAKDAMRDLADGWLVDHLTVDRETNTLMHSPYHHREQRCLLLVSPRMDEGGELMFSSNLPSEERVERGRVVRAYYDIEKAAGVHLVCGGVNRWLMILDANASFRVTRSGCKEGWSELLIRWNGRMLKKSDRMRWTRGKAA